MKHCPALPVLLYHRVEPARGANSITPEQFSSHLRYLSEHGYKTLTCEEYEAWATGDLPPLDKAVLITFDDGYANTFTNAYPILKRFSMHASVFVITEKVCDGPARHGGNGAEPEADDYVRWTEIKEMVGSGVFDVHSHSHAHARWHELYPDKAERLRVLEADLTTSRKLLAEHLGGTGFRHLAWPWGRSRAETRELARRLGFEFQYTVRYDVNTPATPLDQINRLPLDEKSLPAFVACLELFRNPLMSRVFPPLRGSYDRIKSLVGGE